jgi:hypothetical protein
MRGAAFLEKALGGEITGADVEVLRVTHVREDQWLDYKSGLFLEAESGQPKLGKPTEPGRKLRKWVAGFANAEGGALVIGIGDPGGSSPYALSGCGPKLPTLRDWVQRTLAEFYAYLPGGIRVHDMRDVFGDGLGGSRAPRDPSRVLSGVG